MKTYEEIRTIYLKRYPHLTHCTSDKSFAQNALRLAAPTGITPVDTWALAEVANK